jgi:hypothetical protein
MSEVTMPTRPVPVTAVAALLAAPMLIPIPCAAAWPTDAAVNTQVCTEPSTQNYVHVATDGAHGAILAWSDSRPGTLGGTDIYAQRVDSSGAVRWTAGGVVVCNATGAQGHLNPPGPRVVSDNAGGAIIVWPDDRNAATTGTDLYAQRLNANGVPQWDPNGVVVCNAALGQFAVQAVGDGFGGIAVVWNDQRPQTLPEQPFQNYAQRLSGAGAPLWTINGVRLSQPNNVAGGTPRIVADGNGGAFAIFFQHTTTGDQPGGVFSRHLSSTGSTLQLSTLCDGNNVDKICRSDPMDATSDGSGGAVAVWPDFRSLVDEDLYAQRVNQDGTVLWTGDGVRLSSSAGNEQQGMVVADGQGGAIFAWVDFRAVNTDLYAQRVNGLGNVVWTPGGTAVSADSWQEPVTTGSAPNVSMVSDGAGGAMLAWQDGRTRPDTSPQQHMYAQRLDGNGNHRWDATGELVSLGGGVEEFPKLVHDGLQRAIVAWNDTRPSGTGRDIYAQRVPLFGTPVSVTDGIESAIGLGMPAPNPAVDRIRIPVRFGASAAGRKALVESYDVRGRRVATWGLTESTELEWNGSDPGGQALAPGVYLLRLSVDGVVMGPGRRVVWLGGKSGSGSAVR